MRAANIRIHSVLLENNHHHLEEATVAPEHSVAAVVKHESGTMAQ